MTSPKSILVFRTGQLGDTIVSLPALSAIRTRYPEHRLILLTPTQSARLVSPLEVLGAAKIFSETIFYIPPSVSPVSWLRLFFLAIKIRRIKPEMFFYLRGVPYHRFRRDEVFFRILCGIRRSYGFDAHEDIFGRRDASGHLLRYQSEVDRLQGIVGSANGVVGHGDAVEFGLPISGKESNRIDALFLEKDVSGNGLIVGLGPGSKMPAKRWPPDRFLEVAKTILNDFCDARIIIFGGQEDFLLGQEIKRLLGDRVLNTAGQLTVLESAEALRRCRLYVGNDTGVMHLAAAVGTPCVAIFSARNHPGPWDPYGRGHIVLRKEPPCAGCLLEVCSEQDMACLKQISVIEVLEAIQFVLASNYSNKSQCVD